jgi:hypothetical protein
MDVYGKAPAAGAGGYFRNNIWWWPPLWAYVERVAPELTHGVSGYTNDGDGLDADGAARLAGILTAELESGRTAEYAATYEAEQAAVPDEPCPFCDGTGTRTDAVGVKLGFDRRGYCNACGGKGTRRPYWTGYPFSVENVTEFRDFAAASGGFEIW